MSEAMKRREFLELMGAGALAATALPGCVSEQEGKIAKKAPKEKPNILWISCEDISPDLGCYGNSELSTPNIDRLAGQGLKLTNAFTVAPVCAPNRSGIITCMYPNSIGSMHMRTKNEMLDMVYETVPPPYVRCFPEYLHAQGYYCTNRSKTDYQFAPPITAWDCQGENHDDWAGRAAGQPFFSVINYTMTHESMIRTPLEKDPVIDPDSVTIPPYYPDTPVVRRDWARYLDRIEELDKEAGALLERLERDGLAGNTVVFFWSDHGRGLPRAKRWLYDSGIHVPVIVRWPGVIEAGTVSDELVSSIDFGPTVLSIAGVEVPSYMQGRPFLGEQKATPREYIFAHRDRMDEKYDMIRCARDKRFKYLRNFMPEKPYAQNIAYMDLMPTMQEWRRLAAEGELEGPQKLFFQKAKPPEELYDTQADPHEINNLAGNPEYRDVLERMRKALADWMEEIKDLGSIPEKEIQERMWPGGIQPGTARPEIEPDGGKFEGPVRVRIACQTEGASIAYTSDQGENPHWLLCTGEIELDRSARLKARAIRIGFSESPEAQADFEIA
ncbi:MAG TPA: sulfatase-like hydrolase/transferase [archaeon]|nr:sulfatase-like hydrolase/transferase [archaeon]